MPERPKVIGFDASGFERVREVVRRVERGLPARGPEQGDSPLPSAVQVGIAEDGIQSGQRAGVRLVVYDPDDPTAEPVSSDPPEYLDVLNPFDDAVGVESIVLIAEVAGGGWVVLMESATQEPVESFRAPLVKIKGYNASKRQALTHDTAAQLEWLDVEECPE